MNEYYLGIDASKGYSDFVIIDNRKDIIEDNFILDDTLKGHQKLHQILKLFFAKHPKATLYAAIESTGGYENNWYQRLRSIGSELPVKTARINSRGVQHSAKAALKRTGTDKISALTIAEYQVNYSQVIRYDESDDYKSMKRLYTVFRMFIKIQSQLLNELETLLYSGNPELVKYRKSKTPLWLLRLLGEYPVATDLALATVEELVRIPFISSARAEQLIESAQKSVASSTDAPTQAMIRMVVNQIIYIKNSIKELTKEAKKYISVPEIKLIRSVGLFSSISAIGLYIELGGSILNFKSAKHLASFWGLHPRIKDSGDGTLVSKMSKQGRKLPRTILFMSVLNGIQCNSLVLEIYKRELKKGKCKMSAIGVCMHKLARIIYGILKNNKPFDPAINKYHQNRSIASGKSLALKSQDRRYHEEDLDAPISRRQHKKRKERKQSQDDKIVKCEIKFPAPSLTS